MERILDERTCYFFVEIVKLSNINSFGIVEMYSNLRPVNSLIPYYSYIFGDFVEHDLLIRLNFSFFGMPIN